jgi:hypothetical protein
MWLRSPIVLVRLTFHVLCYHQALLCSPFSKDATQRPISRSSLSFLVPLDSPSLAPVPTIGNLAFTRSVRAASAPAAVFADSMGGVQTELCRSWEEKQACRYGAKCQFGS